jgi:D-threo-aldose 1-dehydrogenase
MPASDASRSFADAGLSISRIGFGCASLMRLPSGRDRQRLIAAALDAGVTHFDVARMYGLGAAEAELGRALRQRHEQVTVATKFGIDASGALRRLGPAQRPARALLARSTRVRTAVRGRRELFATPRRYDADRARSSLDQSLRELGLDHVDILFLHDPRPQDEIDGAALVAFLEQARAAGKIRAWGASLDDVSGLAILPRLPVRGVLQLRGDALAGEPIEQPSIVFGALSRHAAIASWVNHSTERRREWTEALGADPLADDLLASLLLADVLARPGVESVLYATTRADRLAVPAKLLRSSPAAAQLDAFAALIADARPSIEAAGTG